MREIFDKRTPGHSDSLDKALALHRMYTKENPKFTWVHLPATNMVWMNDLLRRIMTDSKSREAEFHKMSTFFRDTWLQVPDRVSRSRFMKPQCVTHDGLNKYKAIYMPYLTFSHKFDVEGDQKNASIPELIKAKEKHKSLFDAYQDKVVHGSPTLDESYYHFSDENLSQKDREHRNKTQIITKKLRQDGKESQVWTLLRVNQLWIWVISDELMITSTTHPVDKYEDNLLSNIFDYLSKKAEVGGSHSQPSSAVDMSKILVNYCIDFYEREQVIGTKQSTRQTYFNAINEIAIKETNLYERFSRAQMKVKGNMVDYLHKMLKGEGNETQSDEDMLVAIGEAASLSCSIKDIRDELNILKTIAGYQNDVQTALNSQIQDADRSKAIVSWPRKTDLVRRKGMKYHDKRRAWFSWSSSRDALMDRRHTSKKDPVPVNADYSANHIVHDIMVMDKAADRIHSAVDTILALQQNNTANSQAEEGIRQGRTLMTFTVMTIVFLPLSFLSSIFALDYEASQKTPSRVYGIIVGVAFGVSVALATFALQFNRLKKGCWMVLNWFLKTQLGQLLSKLMIRLAVMLLARLAEATSFKVIFKRENPQIVTPERLPTESPPNPVPKNAETSRGVVKDIRRRSIISQSARSQELKGPDLV